MNGTPTRPRGCLDGESVAIVGSGFGGLAAACYLADLGADVEIFEKNARIGGVAGVIERDGFRFDTGPSWYLMPDVFERFFGHFGRRPDEYYELEHLDPHYRVFWKDGDRADITPELAQVKELFESYEAGAGTALEDYLDTAERSYETGMRHFVYRDRDRFWDFLDTDLIEVGRDLVMLTRREYTEGRVLNLVGSMQDHVERYFEHPKLQQIMQYTLVFLGGSPHNTPALYNLMSHVDFNLGVYYPKGGIRRVVEAIGTLARELGATVHTDRPVIRLEPAPDGIRVVTTDGVVETDRVVSNANPAYVDRNLLPAGRNEREPGYWAQREYAPSAYMLYLGVKGDVDPLAHHSLVLPTDWDGHFERIFENPAWPEDPAYYLSVTSRTDDTVAPEGHHAVVILVPIAPGLEDGTETRHRFRERVLEDLAAHTGVDLSDRIVLEEEACVSEFAKHVNNPKGTALGLAHTLRQTGPFRPGHRSRALDRLYYVGGFTTPGIGMPMCLISGEHTAAAVLEDAGSSEIDVLRSAG